MRFSIITISFNSEKTIERTIKSLLTQTYKDYEYIIVDGASKDGTLGIVKQYEPFFEGRLKWKSEPDNGIYDAMNKGVRMAIGDIIGIVNSDDWLEPDALEKVSEAARSINFTNTLFCGGINFHQKDGEVRTRMANLRTFKWQASILYVMAGIRHPATFVPKIVYNTIGLFNDEMCLSADQDFILRCYFGGVDFKIVDSILSNMSEGGLSTEVSDRAKHMSEEDRKIMLRSFGKNGFSYLWLWYSWKLRGVLKRLLQRFKCFLYMN